VLDLAVTSNVIEKRGAYFRYHDMALGQGRENAKEFLAGNPTLLQEIELIIRQQASLPTPSLALEEDSVAFG
jgi:recombination protein RecA